jgi:hypothetical protein
MLTGGTSDLLPSLAPSAKGRPPPRARKSLVVRLIGRRAAAPRRNRYYAEARASMDGKHAAFNELIRGEAR